jgi:hypothetical protein
VDDSGEADADDSGEGDGVEADSKAAAAVLGPAMEKGGVGSFDDAYKRASVGRSIWREVKRKFSAAVARAARYLTPTCRPPSLEL